MGAWALDFLVLLSVELIFGICSVVFVLFWSVMVKFPSNVVVVIPDVASLPLNDRPVAWLRKTVAFNSSEKFSLRRIGSTFLLAYCCLSSPSSPCCGPGGKPSFLATLFLSFFESAMYGSKPKVYDLGFEVFDASCIWSRCFWNVVIPCAFPFHIIRLRGITWNASTATINTKSNKILLLPSPPFFRFGEQRLRFEAVSGIIEYPLNAWNMYSILQCFVGHQSVAISKHAITQNSSYLRTLFSMATKTVTNYTRLISSSDGPKEPDGRIIYLTNNSIGTNGNEVAKVSRSLDSFWR